VRIKGFEGGQMPLHRRLPKRGFRNTPFQLKFNEVNLGSLQTAIDAGRLDPKATIDSEALIKAGVMRRAKDGVRLLGSGELKAKIDIVVYGASKSAQAAVEKAGGSIKLLAPKKEAAEPRGKNKLAALGKTGKKKGGKAGGEKADGEKGGGDKAEGKSAE
jgi:large subunit ribosomal protein L15